MLFKKALLHANNYENCPTTHALIPNNNTRPSRPDPNCRRIPLEDMAGAAMRLSAPNALLMTVTPSNSLLRHARIRLKGLISAL